MRHIDYIIANMIKQIFRVMAIIVASCMFITIVDMIDGDKQPPKKEFVPFENDCTPSKKGK